MSDDASAQARAASSGASARRGRRVAVAVVAASALAVPASARAYLAHRVDARLLPALRRRLGVDVEVGDVDASLTGAVRIDGVRIGRAVRVGAVEAAVGVGSLLSGRLRADEVWVEAPRIRVGGRRADELGRVVARALARPRHPRAGAGVPTAPPRVVVRGDAVISIARAGTIRARGVALIPTARGPRLVSGPIALKLRLGAWRVSARFERGAADLRQNLGPERGRLARLRRLLVLGGAIDVTARGVRDTHLAGVVLSRGLDARRSGLHLGGRVLGRAASADRFDATLMRERAGAVDLAVTAGRLPLRALAPAVPRWLRVANASFRGRIQLAREPGGDAPIRFSAAGRLAHVSLRHPILAAAPVDVSGRVDLRGRADPGRRTLALSSLRYRRASLDVTAATTLRWDERHALPSTGNLNIAVARAGCQSLLASLPGPFRAHLAGFAARGGASASLRLSFDRARAADPVALAIDVDVGHCRVDREPIGVDFSALAAPFWHTFPDGTRARVGPGTAGYVALAGFPAAVPAAFLAGEDASFYSHHGFDPVQIERSLAENLRAGQVVRGGSTISQQLVKNLFLDPSRTFARKFQEAVLTWQLESHLSKQEILGLYLNIIELAPGVYGVPAAAQHWFGKSPAELTPREAAFLAALAPAPRTTSARIRAAGGVDAATRDRVDQLLALMHRAGALSAAAYREATAARVVLRRQTLARR